MEAGMEPSLKIEFVEDVPDIMNEEVIVEDGKQLITTEEPIYYEEAYVADPDDAPTETVLPDGNTEEEIAQELLMGGGGCHRSNPDLQTAIDLAKFSQQETPIPVGGTPPQRYLILQYPNGSTHRISTSSIKPSNDRSLNLSNAANKIHPGLASPDPFGKPKLSYAAMITEVIKAAPEQRLTLNEIYLAISARYPFYKMSCKNWQNSIRHNLSLNHSFVKIPRPENKGRGHFWTIDPSKEKSFRRHSTGNTPAVLSASKQIVQSNRPSTTYQIVTVTSGNAPIN